MRRQYVGLGEDVTKVLEYVPRRFRVVRHVRPGLLAHVAVANLADLLPLYRQSPIFAHEGVDISRSTQADWPIQISLLLDPVVERVASHVMASVKIHADDTPAPLLAPDSGKTKSGRLWIYLRDNRRWSPSDRPAVLYHPDRKGERSCDYPKTFSGFLQAAEAQIITTKAIREPHSAIEPMGSTRVE